MRAILILTTLSLVLGACSKNSGDPAASKSQPADSPAANAPKDASPATTQADPEFCKETGVAKEGDPAAPKLDETLYDHFGAGVAAGASLEVAEVLANPAPHLGKRIRLSGLITSVCQTKGCWMHLGTEANPVMVKFLDYGFFVPKDASGRLAVVEGDLSFKQESVEETKHYLMDAGKNEEAEKVTEGRKIYRFLASGVAIKKHVQ